MTQFPKTYQAYLLRLWRDGGQAPWRASLENTADGQVAYFGSVRELVRHLEETTAPAVPQADHTAVDNT